MLQNVNQISCNFSHSSKVVPLDVDIRERERGEERETHEIKYFFSFGLCKNFIGICSLFQLTEVDGFNI